MKPLPNNNVFGKSKIDRDLLKSEKWEAAKNYSDMEAAKDIVGNLWSDKKTERLKDFLKNPQEVLFISQPSTSGTNVIPIVLARELGLSLNSKVAVGDRYFKPGHQKLVKFMTSSERTFERRIYVPYDVDEFKKLVSGKELIVVDDLLTSGGSVAEFTRALEHSGAKVVSVVALMGDKRLNIDQSTKHKLETVLNEKKINVSVDDISNIVTRSQAGRMIQMVNAVRTENARKKITERIQGLLDQGPVKSVGRDTKPAGYESANKNDFGDEGVFERVRAWAVREAGRTTEDEVKNKFLSKEAMARINWPPFRTEEQTRLLTKFNAGEVEMIRFSGKDEAVQGRYVGTFYHQGVRVGAIQTGREGEAKLTLVPFTDKLASFENKDVRYDIGRDQVSDRLLKPMRMVMTNKDTGKSFTKNVIIETNGKKSIDDQKNDMVNSIKKQFNLGSKEYNIKFENLIQEKERQQQPEKSLGQSKGLSI